jgi:hypothetical protein
MKFEIEAFYPDPRKTKNGFELGTLHIFLPDVGIDLRGIICIKTTYGVKFKLPYQVTKDKETQKHVLYPIVNFIDDKDLYDFKEFCRDEGVKYIQENHPEVIRLKKNYND